ncbi:WxL domain-containing protein [bacterium]|nr:WxL domain-containing protein [bacterium]
MLKQSLCSLALAGSLQAVGLAQTTSANLNVVGQPFVLLTPGSLSFGTVTLTGNNILARHPLAASSWTINDRSGDGRGWRLKLRGTNFTRTAGPSVGPGVTTTIPISNLGYAGSGVSFSGTGNTIDVANAYNVPGSLNNIQVATADTIVIQTSANGQGMGRATINWPTSAISLDLPYNLAAGSYSATLTLTVDDL